MRSPPKLCRSTPSVNQTSTKRFDTSYSRCKQGPPQPTSLRAVISPWISNANAYVPTFADPAKYCRLVALGKINMTLLNGGKPVTPEDYRKYPFGFTTWKTVPEIIAAVKNPTLSSKHDALRKSDTLMKEVLRLEKWFIAYGSNRAIVGTGHVKEEV